MTRKPIPQAVQETVLAGCRRRCAICFGLDRDTGIKQGQIAHLDQDAGNPSVDNLVFLCLQHHDQLDSRTSQSKGLTAAEVRSFRSELLSTIEMAWRQAVNFGVVQVQPSDGISSHWVRGDDFDSAELEVERLPGNRIRVQGIALHGKTWDIGPNFGELDFEAELADGIAKFGEPGSSTYSLLLRFANDQVDAEEEGAFGHFGAGAYLGGGYYRPK